jgi:hypothetical protein
MRIATLLIFLFAMASAHAAPRCEVSGDARFWAYDACLWHYETDDSLHPEVIRCADKNQALIAKVGSCKAKRIFKDRICKLALQWQLSDPDPKTCMAADKPLGSTVRNGGL